MNKFVSVRDYQMPKQNRLSIAVYPIRKMSYIYRANMLSNALKACVNETDNNQEKDKKS